MFQNILLIVAAVAVAWFLVRMLPGRQKPGIRAYRDATPVNPFSAVSVYPSPAGCQAVQAIKGKRFLSSEAPHLPLAACTAEKCHCVYHHHTDRRTGDGDRRGIGSGALSPGKTNRRLGDGRRKIDKDSDLSWV